MQFYLQKKSFRKYCKDEGIEEQRCQLSRISGKIDLLDMKKLKRPWFVVDYLLKEHFKSGEELRKGNLKKVHEEKCVLTKDEEKTVVETCRFLSRCGLGIDRDTCLEVVNEILRARIEDKEFESVTRGVVNRIISRNKELLGLFSGNSICPERVRQVIYDV